MFKLDSKTEEKLDTIATGVVAANAEAIDREGAFPKAAMNAVAASGLSGLISALEVGGLGQGPGAAVRRDAAKSWVTSAGEATAYVWSSRPDSAEGASTLWLLPSKSPGITSPRPYDGLGLRGNDSRPVTAEKVMVTDAQRLGPDAMLRVLECKAAAGEAASVMATTTDQLYDFIGKAACGLPLF